MIKSTNSKIAKYLLAAGGSFNIIVAIILALMLFGIVSIPSNNYFGGWNWLSKIEGSGLVVKLIIVSIPPLGFLVVGLYGLSGVGLFWRLPWLKKILILLGGLYTIRGFAALSIVIPDSVASFFQKSFPQLFHAFGFSRAETFHDWFFSLLFLVCGLAYVYGALMVSLNSRK